MIFLSRSHLNREMTTIVHRKLGFDFMHVEESDGRARELVMFYKDDNEVALNYFSPNFIMFCSKEEILLSGD